MINERGFFTVVGLCLLLTVAISIMGVQGFETNYSSGAENFWVETELQNIADSALVEAVAKCKDKQWDPGKIELILDEKVIPSDEERFKDKNFKVQVYAIYYENFEQVKMNYPSKKKTHISNETGIICIAVASCEANFMEGEIYRRALAFVLKDDPNQTIHFVNDL